MADKNGTRKKNQATEEVKDEKPKGVSVNDIALFDADLKEVDEKGRKLMDIMKFTDGADAANGVARWDLVGKHEIREALVDLHFFETIGNKYGGGIYRFNLWKKDLTLHSSHEFSIMSEKNGASEEEECSKLPDPRAAQVVLDGHLMQECLETAKHVMVASKIMTRSTEPDPPYMHTRLALALFNRSTRVMPAQDNVFRLALEYIGLLLKQKEAEIKRSEEFKPVGPFTYSGFTSGIPCQHPGLRMIYRHWKPGEDDVISESESILAGNIFEAMAIEEGDLDVLFDGDGIRCPHCSALFPLEKVKSGELWDELAAASAKKASEASMRDDALKRVHEEDKKRDKKEPGES